MSKHWEQNKDATVYVGNIDERFSQELLAELMTQVGPIRQVHMPQDRVSQTHQGYGFVEFDTAVSAEYAARVLNGIRVWGKPIRVNKASADKQKTVDIGAELFINGLDLQVDEKILYDTFSQFGTILRQPNVVRDDNNVSKGYGFVSFDSFEASDVAREAMNGQYLLSKTITVEYAYKKDGKGERHGDEAERKLAAEGKKHNILPERQVLPAGYHMTAASHANGAPPSGPAGQNIPTGPAAAAGGAGGPPPTAPTGPASASGLMPSPYGNHNNMPHPPAGPMPSPMTPGGGMMPPMNSPYGGGSGMDSAPAPPYGGRGGGGGAGPPLFAVGRPLPVVPIGLPPAPSGLPARPPPSQVGFGGFRAGGPPGAVAPPGAPAPTAPTGGVGGPPGMMGVGGYPVIPTPPPGFSSPGMPPPGPMGGGLALPPPGAALPPGFMPPPGAGGGPPIPMVPGSGGVGGVPNGYGRR